MHPCMQASVHPCIRACKHPCIRASKHSCMDIAYARGVTRGSRYPRKRGMLRSSVLWVPTTPLLVFHRIEAVFGSIFETWTTLRSMQRVFVKCTHQSVQWSAYLRSGACRCVARAAPQRCTHVPATVNGGGLCSAPPFRCGHCVPLVWPSALLHAAKLSVMPFGVRSRRRAPNLPAERTSSLVEVR